MVVPDGRDPRCVDKSEVGRAFYPERSDGHPVCLSHMENQNPTGYNPSCCEFDFVSQDFMPFIIVCTTFSSPTAVLIMR